MSKFKQFKEAVKQPRPDRLAKIEYQSHFFQMLGITIVCVILILRDLWWVIFAFIFGIGISYSGGMSAYIKYQNIKALMGDEDPTKFKDDISPTRRRSKITNYVFGKWATRLSALAAVVWSYLLIGDNYGRLVLSLVYPIVVTGIYILLYFFVFYFFANKIMKRR